jgi:hypothetical protein
MDPRRTVVASCVVTRHPTEALAKSVKCCPDARMWRGNASLASFPVAGGAARDAGRSHSLLEMTDNAHDNVAADSAASTPRLN